MCCAAIETLRSTAALFGLSAALLATGQPHCDILLRPAFDHVATDPVQFIDLSETFGQPVAAYWTFGDGGSSTASEPSHAYPAPGWYTVCLTLSTPDGLCSSSICREIVVPDVLDCGWAADFHHANAGVNTLVFSDASSAPGATTHYWEFGDGSHSVEAAPEHSWLLPGLHFVSLVRADGECAATEGRWVEVDGNANTCGTDFYTNINALVLNNSVSLSPEIETSSTAAAQAIIWSFGDGTLDTTWTAEHSYAEPGSYQVCMLALAFDVASFDTCFAYVCETIEVGAAVGLPEAARADMMRVWPVPFQEALSIVLPDAQGPVRLRLLDASGRSVADLTTSPSEVVRFSLPELGPGLYLLEVLAGNERRTRLVARE